MVSPSVVGTRKALRMGVCACLGPVQNFFPITELKSEVGQMGLEPIKEKKIKFFYLSPVLSLTCFFYVEFVVVCEWYDGRFVSELRFLGWYQKNISYFAKSLLLFYFNFLFPLFLFHYVGFQLILYISWVF